MAGGLVTFTAPGSGASAILSGSLPTLSATGTVTVPAAANNIAGSYSVSATATGITIPASFSLTNLPATLVVNNPTDTPVAGETDLRQAITLANSLTGANTITFDPTVFATPQTITLNGTQLSLTNTTGTETITGPAAGVTISGNHTSGVFLVNASVTASISGLTISGGTVTGVGGGLDNLGTVTLTNVTLSGNTASTLGGGLYNKATATLIGCTVSGNTVGIRGGGLWSSGTITLINDILSGNSASTNTGGGLYNKGTATLTGCTVSGNTAAVGGGLCDYGSGATMTLTNVILSGNTAFSGGGLYGNKGTVTLLNCTVTGNTASASKGARGGGILGADGTWTLTDCTLSGNSVTAGNYAYGGGMWNSGVTSLTNCTVTGNTALQGGGLQVGNSGTMTLGNTIVAGNTASSAAAGPDVRQVKGIFVSAGHNLIGMTNGSTGWVASDLTGTSARPVVFWTGTAGNGDWDTASNWSGNAVPGQNPQVLPQVVIPNGVTVNHAANTTENIDSLSLGTGATLNVGNGNFTLNAGSGVWTSSVVSTLNLSGTGSVVVNGGSLSGSGVIRANVTSSVHVAPTTSIVISGSYTQTASGSLDVALAGTNGGTGYGQLFVNGAVMLGGTLDVTLAKGFTPGAGDAFVPLSFGSKAGDFSTKTLPGGLVSLYNANTLVLLPLASTTSTRLDQHGTPRPPRSYPR